MKDVYCTHEWMDERGLHTCMLDEDHDLDDPHECTCGARDE